MESLDKPILRGLEGYWALRGKAGWVERSDLSLIRITGADAVSALNRLCTTSIGFLAPGNSVYTAFCAESAEMKAIAWVCRRREDLLIVTDRHDGDRLTSVLSLGLPTACVLEDLSDSWNIFSLIGPHAQQAAQKVLGDDVFSLSYLKGNSFSIGGHSVYAVRQGMTGESEYQFVFEGGAAHGREILYTSAGNEDVPLCDGAALDTLHLEMKSIVSTRHLKRGTSPIGAGLHWLVHLSKENFPGKSVMARQIHDADLPRVLLGVLSSGERLAPPVSVFLEGQDVGQVLHSVFSPSMRSDIALLHLEGALAWAGLEFQVGSSGDVPRRVQTRSAPLLVPETARQG